MDYAALPIGSRAPDVVNAIIEVPGGQVKELEDKKTEVLGWGNSAEAKELIRASRRQFDERAA